MRCRSTEGELSTGRTNEYVLACQIYGGQPSGLEAAQDQAVTWLLERMGHMAVHGQASWLG